MTWYRGHLYQVADKLGNHLTLVYNKKLVPVPPTTEEELVDIGRSVTADLNGDGKTDRYGLTWNYTEPFFFIPFMTGFGGWIMDEHRHSHARQPRHDRRPGLREGAAGRAQDHPQRSRLQRRGHAVQRWAMPG